MNTKMTIAGLYLANVLLGYVLVLNPLIPLIAKNRAEYDLFAPWYLRVAAFIWFLCFNFAAIWYMSKGRGRGFLAATVVASGAYLTGGGRSFGWLLAGAVCAVLFLKSPGFLFETSEDM